MAEASCKCVGDLCVVRQGGEGGPAAQARSLGAPDPNVTYFDCKKEEALRYSRQAIRHPGNEFKSSYPAS
jgi:hypothetical protein